MRSQGGEAWPEASSTFSKLMLKAIPGASLIYQYNKTDAVTESCLGPLRTHRGYIMNIHVAERSMCVFSPPLLQLPLGWMGLPRAPHPTAMTSMSRSLPACHPISSRSPSKKSSRHMNKRYEYSVKMYDHSVLLSHIAQSCFILLKH